MAHFQIYLPGRQHLAPNDLAAIGLDGLEREGDRPPTTKVGPGPDGGSGLFLIWAPNESPGYCPQRQSWHGVKRDDDKDLAAGRFWFGFDEQSPMTPDDLRRDNFASDGGAPCKIGEHTWTVPWLQWVFFSVRVSRFSRFGDAHMHRVIDALDALDNAKRVGDFEQEAGACMRLCVALLSLNYRVTGGVCGKLGLLEPSSVAAILARSMSAPPIQSDWSDRGSLE